VSRRIIMAGNWKMHRTVQDSVELARRLAEELVDVEGREVLICPPFTALHAVSKVTDDSVIELGAQNLYPAEQGAYTGEISPMMLVDVGCSHVIVGHSERREYFQESDGFVNEKLRAALEFGLKPILCVGESLEQREEGRQRDVVNSQVQRDLQGIPSEAMREIAIAYEPIWAIGTGRTATPQQANEMHTAIREVLRGLYGEAVAEASCIMYGGSVKADNVDELMAEAQVDGALVGGASLEADSFLRIVRFRP
jgi:triosephosphate isomerase